MTIDIHGGDARFGVADEGGRDTPGMREDPGPDGGWGLLLVTQLAQRWGVGERGTQVWFEL